MEIIFRAGASPSERIKDVRIGGKGLDLHRTYSIAGCERDGEPLNNICRMQNVEAKYIPGTIHSVLKPYIKAHSPITEMREGRVRATDLPPVVWSQYGTLQKLWKIPGDAAGVSVPEHRN